MDGGTVAVSQSQWTVAVAARDGAGQNISSYAQEPPLAVFVFHFFVLNETSV
jgi:hypothetical protein